MTTLLSEPASNVLRSYCVDFVAQTEPRVVGLSLALLSDAAYEAMRLEALSRTDHELHIYYRDFLRLAQHFSAVSQIGQDIEQTIHALLQRLLQDDLFDSLLLRAFQSSSTGPSSNWRGTRVGYTVQFWGEHVIQFGRAVINGKEGGEMAEKIRVFFTTEQEMEDIRAEVVEGVRDLKAQLWNEISM